MAQSADFDQIARIGKAYQAGQRVYRQLVAKGPAGVDLAPWPPADALVYLDGCDTAWIQATARQQTKPIVTPRQARLKAAQAQGDQATVKQMRKEIAKARALARDVLMQQGGVIGGLNDPDRRAANRTRAFLILCMGDMAHADAEIRQEEERATKL